MIDNSILTLWKLGAEFLNACCKEYFNILLKFFVRSKAIIRNLDSRSCLSDEKNCTEQNYHGKSSRQVGKQFLGGARR